MKYLSESVGLAELKGYIVFPQVLINILLAATRGSDKARCLLSAVEPGNTDSFTPQSMRKAWPERRSWMVIVFFPTGLAAEIFGC